MQKTNKKSFIIPIALGTLVVALMGTFVLSGTLAKFTSQAQAQSNAVPAAQFLFNTIYEDGKFVQQEWDLESLGKSVDPSYSEKVFYPGTYGAFKLDVDLISDVPTKAEVTITENKKGVYRDEVTYKLGEDVIPVRDLASVKFIVTDKEFAGAASYADMDFSGAEACKLSEFAAKLKTALEETIGDGGVYTPGNPVVAVDETVYVYWNWDFDVDEATDKKDTLFGNFVSQLNNDSIVNATGETVTAEESDYGIGITMTVTQINPEEYSD